MSVEEILVKVRENVPSCMWGWDGRYKAALHVATEGAEDSILDSLRNTFDREWTFDDLSGASTTEENLFEFLGGMRSQQILFTTTLGSDLLCYAAFWPWQGGSHYSIRVGIFEYDSDASPYGEKRMALLKRILLE
jgi:hypothetical protein